jgi:CRP-like cAMP-binding protein
MMHQTNCILSGLPKREMQPLEARLSTRCLEVGDIVHEEAEPLKFVYFPTTAVISLLATAPNEGQVEVAAVGSEGCVGYPAVLLRDVLPFRAVAQTRGEVLRLPAQAFLSSVWPAPAVHELMTRHQHLLIMQLTQSVLCAKAHSLQQRLCRWLLALHDRTGDRKLNVTQQFLSELLNTSRPLLTATAGVLSDAGYILQNRGNITIVDARELARLACPCYRIIGEALKTFGAC